VTQFECLPFTHASSPPLPHLSPSAFIISQRTHPPSPLLTIAQAARLSLPTAGHPNGRTGAPRQPRGLPRTYRRARDTYASDSSFNEHERFYGNEDPYNHPDTDSDRDVYANRYEPSVESLNGKNYDPPAPPFNEFGTSQFGGVREPYPAWSADRQIPLSKEEIEDIFLDLQQKFGFQRDSMRNMVC